jgi:hypothetical protein
MALGDLTIKEQSVFAGAGAKVYNVAAGTLILAGEPVMVRALGNTVVEPAITAFPDQTAHLMVGVAATNSTNTAAAAGTVYVNPVSSATTWFIAPTTAASWDTQAEYDALVGKRVLIANSVSVTSTPTGGTYTLGASDSANNGCVVMPLEVAKYPGKVAISFRTGDSQLS